MKQKKRMPAIATAHQGDQKWRCAPPTPYTPHPTPHTLHPTPYTLQAADQEKKLLEKKGMPIDHAFRLFAVIRRASTEVWNWGRWVDGLRLPETGNSNSPGARPVHQVIAMIKRMRTSTLSSNNSLPGAVGFISQGKALILNTKFHWHAHRSRLPPFRRNPPRIDRGTGVPRS